MADENTEVTLEAMHDAIRLQLAAAFTQFKTVEFYRDEETAVEVPALLLEMTEAEPMPGMDNGTGQWGAMLRFDARIILAANSPAMRMQVRKAATNVGRWLNLRHFAGVYAEAAQVIACEPDEFAPNLDRFHVWRVEFVIPALLGENVWLHDGDTPSSFYSFVPRVGLAHEADYRPAVEPIP